jgi:hypothetical protein
MFPFDRPNLYRYQRSRGYVFFRFASTSIGFSGFRKLATEVHFYALPIDVIHGRKPGQPRSASRVKPALSPGPSRP